MVSVKSNPKRELVRAQAALNESVLNYLTSLSNENSAFSIGRARSHTRLTQMAEAYKNFDKASRVLEGAGAASARRTSIAAAHTNLPSKMTVRGQVIYRVWEQSDMGATTAELERIIRKSHQTVSSAVNYAEAAGWIKDSGITRKTQFGRDAIVYITTPKAVEAIEAGRWRDE